MSSTCLNKKGADQVNKPPAAEAAKTYINGIAGMDKDKAVPNKAKPIIARACAEEINKEDKNAAKMQFAANIWFKYSVPTNSNKTGASIMLVVVRNKAVLRRLCLDIWFSISISI